MLSRIVLAGLFLALPPFVEPAAGNVSEPFELRRSRAAALVQTCSTDAIAALEKLQSERPEDATVLFYLGLALGEQARQLDPGEARRTILQQARNLLLKAREAGIQEPLLQTALAEINPDGAENVRQYSENAEAERLYRQAETAFGKHDYPGAQKFYQAVLNVEPAHYMAKMGMGDAFYASGQFQKAVEWFEKAATQDPSKAIAYRYWGDALLRLGRKDDALEKYLSAVIAEPYDGYSWRALHAGCQAMLLKPWMAGQKIPLAEVKDGAKGPEIVLPKEFNALHIVYTTARAQWQTENKARRFPAGTAYRQTMEEEIHALTMLVKIHGELKQSGQPPSAELATALADAESSITELAEIEKAGYLPAHILFFRANQGIAQDYAAYREANRGKLREYLWKYYLHLP